LGDCDLAFGWYLGVCIVNICQAEIKIKSMQAEARKKPTANQLYRQYRDEGGVLNFAGWLDREKTKGNIPLNSINEEVIKTINNYSNEKPMQKTILGVPVSLLVVTGVIIVGSYLAYKYMKK
jgi:hypothetical protein